MTEFPPEVLKQWLDLVLRVPRLSMPIVSGYGREHEPHDVLTELAAQGKIKRVAMTKYYADWERV